MLTFEKWLIQEGWAGRTLGAAALTAGSMLGIGQMPQAQSGDIRGRPVSKQPIGKPQASESERLLYDRGKSAGKAEMAKNVASFADQKDKNNITFLAMTPLASSKEMVNNVRFAQSLKQSAVEQCMAIDKEMSVVLKDFFAEGGRVKVDEFVEVAGRNSRSMAGNGVWRRYTLPRELQNYYGSTGRGKVSGCVAIPITARVRYILNGEEVDISKYIKAPVETPASTRLSPSRPASTRPAAPSSVSPSDSVAGSTAPESSSALASAAPRMIGDWSLTWGNFYTLKESV